MNELRRIVLNIFAISISMAVSYLTLTKGWGMEVRSWWWVIGCGFFGHVIALSLVALANAKDK